jgi:hypothetical protein
MVIRKFIFNVYYKNKFVITFSKDFTLNINKKALNFGHQGFSNKTM